MSKLRRGNRGETILTDALIEAWWRKHQAEHEKEYYATTRMVSVSVGRYTQYDGPEVHTGRRAEKHEGAE